MCLWRKLINGSRAVFDNCFEMVIIFFAVPFDILSQGLQHLHSCACVYAGLSPIYSIAICIGPCAVHHYLCRLRSVSARILHRYTFFGNLEESCVKIPLSHTGPAVSRSEEDG